MAAALPTESTLDKAVKDFGVGTYDSQRDDDGQHGEDSEREERTKKTLPDGGGSLDPFGPDRLLSYPAEKVVTSMTASGMLSYQDRVRIHDPLYREWFRRKLGEIIANPHGSVSWFPFGPSPTLLKVKAEMKTYLASKVRRSAAAEVPGDHDETLVPSNHDYPPQETLDSRVMTVSQEEESDEPDAGGDWSGLPSGEPVARSDYYDHMTRGQVEQKAGPQKPQERTYELWPDEDSGAWAGARKAESELPGVSKNEVQMDDFLSALGNAWSGYEVEDVSGEQGFPSLDKQESADYSRSDRTDGGRILPPGGVASVAVTQKEWQSKMDDAMKIEDEQEKARVIESLYADLFKDAKTKEPAMDHTATRKAFQQYHEGRITLGDALNAAGIGVSRRATNLAQVADLTAALLKEYGKQGLTKRHVLAFLQGKQLPQYLSSDIIRCLKLRHSVYVKDVLDEFPIAKQASGEPTLASIRSRVIALEIEAMRRPEVSSVLRRCAAALSRVIADVERLEGHG